jgi:hypothetical protein
MSLVYGRAKCTSEGLAADAQTLRSGCTCGSRGALWDRLSAGVSSASRGAAMGRGAGYVVRVARLARALHSRGGMSIILPRLRRFERSRAGTAFPPFALLLASHCSPSGGANALADAGANEAEVVADATAVDCGALGWVDPECTSCTNAGCCELEALCATLPSCSPLHQCWTACAGDAGCQAACGTTYIDSISNYNAILNCQMSTCRTECGD